MLKSVKHSVFFSVTVILTLSFLLSGCKSGQKKDKEPEIITQKKSEFFSQPAENSEVFRVFVHSDGYERRQLEYKDKISVKSDPGGDEAMSAGLTKYNKIDYFANGVIMVELYPDSGSISRVRFARPSGIAEMDQLISDDVTRWEFKFSSDTVHPRKFAVNYGILLQNEVSREEALKTLKENAN